MFNVDMQVAAMALAGIGGLLLLILLVYIAFLHWKIKKLETKYTFFMQDETGTSVEAKLRDDVEKLHNLQGTLDLIHQTQKDIMAVQNHCFRKIGFVKYNAFDNIGNNLSFAFTVLDGKNDGFCLSSVYGRNESRIFAKPIVDGKCLYGMSEEEKEEFLSMFDEDNKETHVGFCVLGGHFSEGIDLTNDKLIGVIIVGVGMPQIGIERDIIKDHMKDSNKGFDYAYVYPGMIKVLQAAGRCIRTDDDKGVILLLDNRYSQRRYQSLFPYEWYPNFRVRKSDDVKTLCEKFWRN